MKTKAEEAKTREFPDVQFVTNDAGETTGVIIPISEYQDLLEDLEDLAVIAERRDEPTIPHRQVVDDLKRDGKL